MISAVWRQPVMDSLTRLGNRSIPVMGKSQIKSNHDVNQMTTVPDSIVYVRNVIKCTSGLTVNVSAKIRDGTITEINSLTQLQ